MKRYKINRILNFLLIFTTILLLSNNIFSQAIYFGSDTTLYKGDSAMIIMDTEYRGDIQWQKSTDGTTWEDLVNQNSDTLSFYAEETVHYRAMISEGTCDPVYSDTTNLTVVELADNVVVLDSTTTDLISDSTQLANGSYVFEFSGETPDIPINSVIVGNEGEGYLRKVTGVNINGNTATVETDSACLTDVMTEAIIEDSILISINSLKKAYVNGVPIPIEVVYLPEGATLKKKGSGIDLSNTYLIDETVTYEYTNEDSSETFSAEAHLAVLIESGEIVFEPIFNRKVKISLSGINELALSAGGQLDFNMDIKVECDAKIDYAKEITLAKFQLAPVMIGPVPMIITLSFNAGFQTHLDVAASTTTGFESGVGLEFGASYKKNYGWESIWNKSTSFDFHEPVWEASANASARIYVEPEIATKIAGVAGPTLGVEPYLRFDGQIIYPNWQYGLYAGLDGKLGFEVGIFNFELVNYEKTLLNYETTLYENSGTVDFGLPTVVTNNATDITTNSATLNGEITNDGGTDIIFKGFIYNTSTNPSIENDSIVYDLDEGLSLNEIADNLTENTTYYVKAFAENSAGIAYGEEVNFTTNSGGSAPVADFSASTTSITEGSSVTFTDLSTNTPTSWTWDFGDGGTSTEQNPSYTYNTAGSYTVALTATNSYGSNTETKTNYIVVTTSGGTGTVTDYDGNVYQTVVIGNQEWMAENLKTTHYADGTLIPLVESTSGWDALGYTDKAYCYYNNNANNEKDTYGALYTWAAAMNGAASSVNNPSGIQGVCPTGWHLPSDAEWTELTEYLTNNGYGYEGSGNDIGKSMASTSGWEYYSAAGTVGNDQASNNSSGFAAFPGGYRHGNGNFHYLGYDAYYWSATEDNSSDAYGRSLYYDYSNVYRNDNYKYYGFSTRCIKD